MPVYEKQGLEDRVARLSDGGGTFITAGLMKAIALLERLQGSKNIILISDGKTQGEGATRDAARLAHNQGIKIYTVGVGPTTNEVVMQDIATIANVTIFLQSINWNGFGISEQIWTIIVLLIGAVIGITRMLKDKNIPFEERNVTENIAFFRELQEKSGQTLTPTLDIDGEILADSDTGQVAAYLKEKHVAGF